jgi:hypothetical protein
VLVSEVAVVEEGTTTSLGATARGMTLVRLPPPDAPELVVWLAYPRDIVDGRRERLRNSSSVGGWPGAHGVAIARPVIVVVGMCDVPVPTDEVVVVGKADGVILFGAPAGEGTVRWTWTCSLLHSGVRIKPILDGMEVPTP